MMARPRGELDVAQLPQLAPLRGLIQRDRKFVMKPLHRIDRPPGNNVVDRRAWTLLDDVDKRPGKRPVKTVASYGRFRENGREVGMTGGGWLGERRLCGFFGGDHLLVNQTFISPGYSH